MAFALWHLADSRPAAGIFRATDARLKGVLVEHHELPHLSLAQPMALRQLLCFKPAYKYTPESKSLGLSIPCLIGRGSIILLLR